MKRLIIITLLVALPVLAQAFGFGFDFGFNNRNQVQWIDLLPNLSVWDQALLTYPDINVGSEYALTNAFHNTGNYFAEDLKVSITGPDAAMFRNYSATGSAFFNLSSGRTFSTKVKFKPTSPGAKTAYLNYSAPNIARKGIILAGLGVSVPLVGNKTNYSVGGATFDAPGGRIYYHLDVAQSSGVITKGYLYSTGVTSVTCYMTVANNTGTVLETSAPTTFNTVGIKSFTFVGTTNITQGINYSLGFLCSGYLHTVGAATGKTAFNYTNITYPTVPATLSNNGSTVNYPIMMYITNE